jgi:hypothetical protein
MKKLTTFRVWHLTKLGIGTETIKATDAKDAKKRKFKVLTIDKVCI